MDKVGEGIQLKEIAFKIMLAWMLVNALCFLLNARSAKTVSSNANAWKTQSELIIVPDNYSEIQDAIDAASVGDTVFVRAGTYNKTLTINKTLTLVGENPDTTVIDGIDNQNTILYVGADNVNISGFTLKLGDYGIWLHECSGCKISNNILLNIYFHWGIYLDHSVNNVVTNNTILPGHMAIYASYSNSNIISANHMVHNRVGVILEYSFNNIMRDNKFEENEEVAIFLLDSGGSVLSNNTLIGNCWGFHIWGDQLSHFINDIDTSNTLDGKPAYYWVNQRDKQVPLDAGYIGLINCSNIVARDLNISHSGEGVLLAYTNDSLIENVSATSYIYYGINALYCYHNIIRNNNLTKCRGAGMFMNSSDCNLLKGNAIEYGDDGLAMTSCWNNTIVENSISYNDAGVIFGDSSNNSLYHNNIVGNGAQTSISSFSINSWDNGVEGNYWRHFQANDTNPDGIEDNAYVIDENNQDNHPLMGMFHSFSISLDNEVGIISNSTLENFEYIESNGTIRLNVFGATGRGFCRICIPHALMNPNSINVIIDEGNTPLLYCNYSLYDNGTHRWIYFEYNHSSHQITIIPESTSTIIILLTMSALGLEVVAAKKKKLPSTHRLVDR